VVTFPKNGSITAALSQMCGLDSARIVINADSGE
jgi:hypothetical protein